MRYSEIIAESDEPWPRVVGDDGDVAHAKYAVFDDAGASIRFWKVASDQIVIQSMASSPQTRGRDMLAWLNREYRLPVTVVEAVPESMGFWRKMRREKLVHAIKAATGWPSPLENASVPF